MADVFNRITKEYKKSVNTPDYPKSEWIINPDFVPDCERKYMIVEGDTIREMATEEKAVVDYVEPAPEPTDERIEQQRIANIQAEIRKTYSASDEIGIIRESLTDVVPDNIQMKEWNKAVKAAKDKYPKV